MPLDMNDAEPQRSNELIPDGTLAKVAMTIRPGGIDGPNEIDRGLLKASSLSDALLLDCEFTVTEGPHARRKFWQMFTVAGGKVDEQGVSIGWKISKSTFRAMIDSALGLDPNDMSETTKQKRILRGLADLNGIVFVAKIRVEPSDNPAYRDQNRLDRVVLPNEKGWKAVMEGREVAPSPSRRATAATAQPSAQPAWNRPATAQPPAPTTAPAWAGTTTPVQSQPQQAAKPAGPAWLNG
jgi:hypothetical protein